MFNLKKIKHSSFNIIFKIRRSLYLFLLAICQLQKLKALEQQKMQVEAK